MQHRRSWQTSFRQLHRRVSILTQCGKKSDAKQIGVSSSAHDKASITQIRRESIRFDFDPMWEEIECQADDIGALAKKAGLQ